MHPSQSLRRQSARGRQRPRVLGVGVVAAVASAVEVGSVARVNVPAGGELVVVEERAERANLMNPASSVDCRMAPGPPK